MHHNFEIQSIQKLYEYTSINKNEIRKPIYKLIALQIDIQK